MNLYDLIRKKKNNFDNLRISKDLCSSMMMQNKGLNNSVDSARSSRKSNSSCRNRSSSRSKNRPKGLTFQNKELQRHKKVKKGSKSPIKGFNYLYNSDL